MGIEYKTFHNTTRKVVTTKLNPDQLKKKMVDMFATIDAVIRKAEFDDNVVIVEPEVTGMEYRWDNGEAFGVISISIEAKQFDRDEAKEAVN